MAPPPAPRTAPYREYLRTVRCPELVRGVSIGLPFLRSNVEVTGTLRQGAAWCTILHGAARPLAAACPCRLPS